MIRVTQHNNGKETVSHIKSDLAQGSTFLVGLRKVKKQQHFKPVLDEYTAGGLLVRIEMKRGGETFDMHIEIVEESPQDESFARIHQIVTGDKP